MPHVRGRRPDVEVQAILADPPLGKVLGSPRPDAARAQVLPTTRGESLRWTNALPSRRDLRCAPTIVSDGGCSVGNSKKRIDVTLSGPSQRPLLNAHRGCRLRRVADAS